MPLHHNLTSLYGGTGTLAMYGNGTRHTNTVVGIRSSESSEIVAMLREAIEYLGAGSDTRHDDDLLTIARAQRDEARRERDVLRQERDEARKFATAEHVRSVQAEKERDEWKDSAIKAMADLERAGDRRPLTADAIESVLHDILPLSTEHLGADDIADIASDLYTALTEPPRPEGAEELARLIATADVGEWDCGDLADALLATGRVRVVTEEQP